MSIRKRLILLLVMGILIPIILVTITMKLYRNESCAIAFIENYNDFIIENEIESKIAFVLNKIDRDYSINPSSVYGLSYFEDIERDFLNIPLYISVDSKLVGSIHNQSQNYSTPNHKVYNYGHIEVTPINYQKYVFTSAKIETVADDVLTIEFSTSFPIKRKTSEDNKYMYLLTVFIVLIALYVSLFVWVYRSILKPLNRLHGASKRFSKGDYSVRIRKYSDDEFGEISRSFDQMRDEREDKILLKEMSDDKKDKNK